MRPAITRGELGFPLDDYTPHGYLRNPHDAGPWWGLSAGGPLRSVAACGFEWRTSEQERGGLQVGIRVGDAVFLRPEDFSTRGVTLVSRYHSTNVQTFDFEYRGVRVHLTFLLPTRDAIACRARLSGRASAVELLGAAFAAKRKHRNASGRCWESGVAVAGEPGPWYALRAGLRPVARGFAAGVAEVPSALAGPQPPSSFAFDAFLEAPTVYGAMTLPADLTSGEADVWLVVGRGSTPDEAARQAEAALGAAPAALERRLGEDSAFWAGAPRLTGDWPDSWRRGWVYDLETTRMLVYPSSGVLDGPWPSWMAYYPRVVLAENTLDMLRLGQAAPELAWDAVETVFRVAAKADMANVPCVYANGVYNMVASDGSICGTSPAWCLPFLNVYLLYLSHPDRSRLGRVYPHLVAYLEWWLDHRTDPQGWVVYKCTWEAGEDCTPRLDPEATGHTDISEVIRPVELQAAVAHSARILVRLGRELGRSAGELARWEAVYADYRDRTRQMWDPGLARFRDVLRATGQFSQSDATYWGRDVHHDALQLIPLLDEIAAPDQSAALAAKLGDFDSPPWTLWPSWSYVVAEAARAVGRRELAADLSSGILSRVYAENDRRDLTPYARPLPGAAREYWPVDLAAWDAHEAYGWGANTLMHLLRYVVGFGPSADTSAFELEVAPSLPQSLLVAGAKYGVANLPYRERRVSLDLRPRSDGAVEVGVGVAPGGGALRVRDESGQPLRLRAEGDRLWFVARRFGLYRVSCP